MLDDKSFLRLLLGDVPEAELTVDEHLRDNDGERSCSTCCWPTFYG